MLRSHTGQEQTFDYYASFLRSILGGEDKYKPLIAPVIDDAKSLVQHQKDYFTISRSGFDVIVYLAKIDPTFFSELDTNEISDQDYQHILDLIDSKKDLIMA